MNPQLLSMSAAPEQAGPAPHFNVLIVYEDMACGVEAMRLYQHLSRSRNPGFDFNFDMWRFDVLDLAQINDLAAEQAVRADLVIVSVCGGAVPHNFTTWVKCWMGKFRGAENGAIVVLYGGNLKEARNASLVVAVLRSAADMNGRQFFAEQTDPNGKPELAADRLRRIVVSVTPMVSRVLHEIEPVQSMGLIE
jgi:hypothetical protein